MSPVALLIMYDVYGTNCLTLVPQKFIIIKIYAEKVLASSSHVMDLDKYPLLHFFCPWSLWFFLSLWRVYLRNCLSPVMFRLGFLVGHISLKWKSVSNYQSSFFQIKLLVAISNYIESESATSFPKVFRQFYVWLIFKHLSNSEFIGSINRDTWHCL